MKKIPNLSGKELGKIIEKIGFILNHQRGSHLIYKNLDGRVVVIPHHSGEKIGPGLLNKIIKKDLMITRKEFLELMK